MPDVAGNISLSQRRARTCLLAHSSLIQFSGSVQPCRGEIILEIIILKILRVGSQVLKLRAPKLKINPQKVKTSPLFPQCPEGGVGLACAEFGTGTPKPTRPMHAPPPFQVGFCCFVFPPWGRFARWDGISQILVGRQLHPGRALGKMGCPHRKCQRWQEAIVKKGFIFPNVEITFWFHFLLLQFLIPPGLALRHSEPPPCRQCLCVAMSLHH